MRAPPILLAPVIQRAQARALAVSAPKHVLDVHRQAHRCLTPPGGCTGRSAAPGHPRWPAGRPCLREGRRAPANGTQRRSTIRKGNSWSAGLLPAWQVRQAGTAPPRLPASTDEAGSEAVKPRHLLYMKAGCPGPDRLRGTQAPARVLQRLWAMPEARLLSAAPGSCSSVARAHTKLATC